MASAQLNWIECLTADQVEVGSPGRQPRRHSPRRTRAAVRRVRVPRGDSAMAIGRCRCRWYWHGDVHAARRVSLAMLRRRGRSNGWATGGDLAVRGDAGPSTVRFAVKRAVLWTVSRIAPSSSRGAQVCDSRQAHRRRACRCRRVAHAGRRRRQPPGSASRAARSSSLAPSRPANAQA